MNLDGIYELEFRSSERRRWVRWARVYKHLTPNGVKTAFELQV